MMIKPTKNMEELIKKIVDKTGITPEQAKNVLAVIVDHVKDNIPSFLRDKVEKMIKK